MGNAAYERSNLKIRENNRWTPHSEPCGIFLLTKLPNSNVAYLLIVLKIRKIK